MLDEIINLNKFKIENRNAIHYKFTEKQTILSFHPKILPSTSQIPVLQSTLAYNKHDTRRHKKGTISAIHHGFHSITKNNQKVWTIFGETSLNLLLAFKFIIIEIDKLLRIYHFDQWKFKKSKLPQYYSLFNTC
jgi:hypothetical protein